MMKAVLAMKSKLILILCLQISQMLADTKH